MHVFTFCIPHLDGYDPNSTRGNESRHFLPLFYAECSPSGGLRGSYTVMKSSFRNIEL